MMGVGHLVPLESPQECAGVVGAWIEGEVAGVGEAEDMGRVGEGGERHGDWELDGGSEVEDMKREELN